MIDLTIGEIERLLEAIENFGEYFDDWEVLDSAKRKLEKKLQSIVAERCPIEEKTKTKPNKKE